MLVKDRNKSIFSISDAKELIQNKERVIQVSPNKLKSSRKGIKLNLFSLKDSNGDFMKMGENYVIFVFAVLDNDYKKLINTFDDYLTASSRVFKLTDLLQKAKKVEVQYGKEKTEDKTKNNKNTQYLSFSAPDSEDIEYRCMFLPIDACKDADFMTPEGLKNFETDIKKLEKLEEKYDEPINDLIQELASVQEILDNTTDKSKKEKLKTEIVTLREKITKLEKEKQKAESSIKKPTQSDLGFFFNLLLAEHVSAANYVVPTNKDITKTEEKEIIITEFEEVEKEAKKKITINTYNIPFEPEFTDNFGNRLVDKDKYMAVVLAYSTTLGTDKDIYTNALSNMNTSSIFTYHSQIPTK